MKWFGRKSAGRADARPVLARGWSSAQAVRPWTYEDGVRAGYVANPIVQRAVRLIAEGVGAVPLTGAVPEAVALVQSRTAGQALLETVAMQVLLHGNGFVRVMSPRAGEGEETLPPCDLFALRPEREGGAVWRLSALWRGRLGTPTQSHVAGEVFALIDSASLRILASDNAVPGALISAQGVGDAVPVSTTVASADRALRPLSPVRLRRDDGVLSWVRRSRDGFVWRDGVDVPLAEEREAYLVTASGGGTAISIETAAAKWALPIDFAAAGTTVSVAVRQIGRHGLSDPGEISFTI